jgi:hypothetical protein
LLQDTERISEMTNHNYALGRKYYSYDVLRENLKLLIQKSVFIAKR